MLSHEAKEKDGIMLEYQKESLFFNIVKGSIHDKINVNTEYSDSKTVSVNDIEYLVYGEPEHGCGVLWNMNDYTYNLMGNLEEDEMLRIAASIR